MQLQGTETAPAAHTFLRQALMLFMIHAVGDFYAAFQAPLLPVLREQFDLTLSSCKMLGAFYLIVQNFSQPLFGALSERFGRRALLVIGISSSALGMSGLGLARSYGTAFIPLTVGALGIGMFHPLGAALAGDNRGRRSAAMTFYMVGGSIGIMCAPLIVPVLAQEHLRLVMLLCLPGILVAAWLALKLPREVQHNVPPPKAIWAHLWRARWPLFWLHVRVVLRFVPMQVVLAFLPLYCTTRGYSPAVAGRIYSLALFMSALGVALGGWVTMRLPRRTVMIVSELAAAACFLAFPMTNGLPFLLLLGAGVLLAYTAFPLQIVMAQEVSPAAKGTAAAIVMGLAYGNAALLVLPLNKLGDLVAQRTGSEFAGLSWQFQIASLGFFVAAVIALFLRLGENTIGAEDKVKIA